MRPLARASRRRRRSVRRTTGRRSTASCGSTRDDRDTDASPARPKNDELLGGHGDDRHLRRPQATTSSGATTRPPATPRSQKDTLYGGRGKDWIYASHGRNTIYGGRRRTTPSASGSAAASSTAARASDDILYVSKTQNKKVKRRNCERVSHKSAKDAVHDRNDLYYSTAGCRRLRIAWRRGTLMPAVGARAVGRT